MYYNFAWRPYVSVAQKRRNAERELAKLKKRGQSIAPVRIEGRKMATSLWGEAWCSNLERYSDCENRLPRGRSYVRNGSVVDLQIGKGEITGSVASFSNSVLFAFSKPQTFRANSIVATCIPRHSPRYGILFSRANFAALIFPSTPRSPNPPGINTPATSLNCPSMPSWLCCRLSASPS